MTVTKSVVRAVGDPDGELEQALFEEFLRTRGSRHPYMRPIDSPKSNAARISSTRCTIRSKSCARERSHLNTGD